DVEVTVGRSLVSYSSKRQLPAFITKPWYGDINVLLIVDDTKSMGIDPDRWGIYPDGLGKVKTAITTIVKDYPTFKWGLMRMNGKGSSTTTTGGGSSTSATDVNRGGELLVPCSASTGAEGIIRYINNGWELGASHSNLAETLFTAAMYFGHDPTVVPTKSQHTSSSKKKRRRVLLLLAITAVYMLSKLEFRWIRRADLHPHWLYGLQHVLAL
ncbi:MAG: hypothetical protein V1753_02120, partial [Pseudomonadota bacterium]